MGQASPSEVLDPAPRCSQQDTICIPPREAEGRRRSEHWPTLQIPVSGKKGRQPLTTREDTTLLPAQSSTLQNLRGRTCSASKAHDPLSHWQSWNFSGPPANLSLQTPQKQYGPRDHLPQSRALTVHSLGDTAPVSPFTFRNLCPRTSQRLYAKISQTREAFLLHSSITKHT